MRTGLFSIFGSPLSFPLFTNDFFSFFASGNSSSLSIPVLCSFPSMPLRIFLDSLYPCLFPVRAGVSSLAGSVSEKQKRPSFLCLFLFFYPGFLCFPKHCFQVRMNEVIFFIERNCLLSRFEVETPTLFALTIDCVPKPSKKHVLLRRSTTLHLHENDEYIDDQSISTHPKQNLLPKRKRSCLLIKR